MSGRQTVPVTIIGGYLGAGKTTLINELLTGNHRRRLTIVVNDFGAVSIDAALIASREGDTISLINGCICCSIAGDLTTELRRLSRTAPIPEQIMVEASGVADPARVANAVKGWSSMRLHRTVTLFDPLAVRSLSNDKFAGTTVKRQLRHARLLMPARTDLVTRDQVASVLEWIAQAFPEAARQVVGPWSRSEQIALLLDLSASESDRPSDDYLPMRRATSASPAFASFTWYPRHPVNEGRLRAVLGMLGNRLQRCKGWVVPDRSVYPAAIVQHGAAGTQIDAASEMPADRATLVFIYASGQCSNDELERLLVSCQSAPG